MLGQDGFSIRPDIIPFRSDDLRDVIITPDERERAARSDVVIVDVSLGIRPVPSFDTGERLKVTYAVPAGLSILETLGKVMERDQRRAVDLGFFVRVFRRDSIRIFRYRTIPPDLADVKLVEGDVIVVSR
ncbi:MAG: hypothetical protein HZC55_18170 [Verrucomicrobia bacterium]|nr:hypothetical protein [Verrucomicrobiota bacterium]